MSELQQPSAHELVDLECNISKGSLQLTEKNGSKPEIYSTEYDDAIASSNCAISTMKKSNTDSNNSCRKSVPISCKNPVSVAKRNARERKRIKNVNKAFDELRQHVPLGCHNKKISKVDTLQSAIEYIKALEQLVKQRRNVEDDKENVISSDQSQNSSDLQERGLVTCPGDLEKEVISISSQFCHDYEITTNELPTFPVMKEQCNPVPAAHSNAYTEEFTWFPPAQCNTNSHASDSLPEKDVSMVQNDQGTVAYSSFMGVADYENCFDQFIPTESSTLKPVRMNEVPFEIIEERMEKLPDTFDQSLPFSAFQDGYRFGDECSRPT